MSVPLHPLHGVALVKISTSPVRVDNEFYAVFVHGEMRPTQWRSWSEAFAHFTAEAGARDERATEFGNLLDAMFGTNQPAKETA